jgi:glutathione S-transferase
MRWQTGRGTDNRRPLVSLQLFFHPFSSYSQKALIPQDTQAAIEVRMMDRVFDNYVSTPQQRVVYDALRPPEVRDAHGVAQAKAMLDKVYAWLDERMAAPALFYADWTHPIAERFAHLRADRARLLARPSFARAVDETRPFGPYFPLGAPDRD